MSASRPIADWLRPSLLDVPPYVPVVPPSALAERLGLPVERILKLDANEDQYGPSPKVAAALAQVRSFHIYPDPAQMDLRTALARYLDVDPEMVVAGAGSDELIELAIRLFVPPGESILNFPPTFGMYSFLAGTLGAKAIELTRRPDYSLDLDAIAAEATSARLIFVVSPNNPTGTLVSRDELEALLALGPPVVIDEAYAEFAGESHVDLVRQGRNLIVVRTMSKWAGLAGLRVGYMVCAPAVAAVAMRVKQPYNVNVAAEVAALASLADLPYLQDRMRDVVAERERLAGLLAALPGFEVTPSRANFVLCRLDGAPAAEVHARLLERGIMVRYFDNPLLQNHLRITAGRPEQTDRLISALREVVEELKAKAGAAS